jgi:hypothetical protein
MGNTIDLSQGLWRFHTIHGLVSLDDMKKNPAQPSGTNTDVVFSFMPHSESREFSEGVALSGPWLRSKVHKETPAPKPH